MRGGSGGGRIAAGGGHLAVGAARLAAAAVLALALTACSTTRATFPPPGATTAPAGVAAEATVRQVIAAAGAKGVAVRPADRPYRPPEGPLLAAAPRTVLQASIPNDPEHGYVVVYELGGATAAANAAADEAAYIASGPGRVQFTPDTRYVLRVVGSTVVFFHWSPGTSPATQLSDLAAGLATLGDAVAIPG
jgi:hypothetical protein